MPLAFLLVALALLLPSAAQAQVPDDVSRIHAAVTELAKAKRDAAGRVAQRKRAAEAALAGCRSAGAGWKRIRAVRDASQRGAYRRGARVLWGELHQAALEQAALDAYDSFFTRFLARLERPLSDPVLQAGADALRERIGYQREAYAFASCATFELLLRKVREFKIGGGHGVAGDYRAGRIHNLFTGFVAGHQRAAERRHGGTGYESALQAARERIVALGGDSGYASYFAFAHSLRG
jgi:hypothetical protein